jgi:hypothetical protein
MVRCLGALVLAAVLLLPARPARAWVGGANPVGAPAVAMPAASWFANTEQALRADLTGTTQARPELVAGGGIAITASGARCDGSTDDHAAIDAFLARHAHGATIVIPPGRRCAIAAGDLVVPPGVRIVGAGTPVRPSAAGVMKGSGFVLGPHDTIVMGAGSRLENVGIWRAGLIAHPTASQAIGAVQAWGAERSVAVTIPANTGGVSLEGLFIEGLNTAILARAGEFDIDRVWIDCYNGIAVTRAADNSHIADVRLEPFYSGRTDPASGSWDRMGIAFDFWNNDTGLYLTRAFAFMWANGIVVNDIGIASITDSGFEWNATVGGGIPTGVDGIRYLNGNPAQQLRGSYFGGYATDVSVETAELTATDVDALSSTVAGFYLGGGQAPATTIAIGGTPVAGSTVTATATLTGRALGATPVAVAVGYTAVAGDTQETMAEGLAQAIDAEPTLIAARIGATWSGAVARIDGPADVALRVSAAATGGITVTSGIGPAGSGGSGAIVAARVEPARGPAFVVGNRAAGALAWTIADPYLNNATQALRPGWLQVWAPRYPLYLSGIPWSAFVNGGRLHGCGTGSTISATATDGDGTITEGAGAAGCTLVFATPFYDAPVCLVTPLGGAPVTVLPPRPTALTVTNPRADREAFAYRCRPG